MMWQLETNSFHLKWDYDIERASTELCEKPNFFISVLNVFLKNDFFGFYL